MKNQNALKRSYRIYGEQSDTNDGLYPNLFIYRLFNDAVSSRDYRMIGWLVNKELWKILKKVVMEQFKEGLLFDFSKSACIVSSKSRLHTHQQARVSHSFHPSPSSLLFADL